MDEAYSKRITGKYVTLSKADLTKGELRLLDKILRLSPDSNFTKIWVKGSERILVDNYKPAGFNLTKPLLDYISKFKSD